MMDKRYSKVLMLTMGWALFSFASIAGAQDGDVPPEDGGMHGGESLPMPNCVAMSSQEANFAKSVETDDGPIFVCCDKCLKKVRKNTEDFAEAAAAQREELADRPKVQVKCPVTGKDADHAIFIEQDGQQIYFRDEESRSAYEENPEEYAPGLANSYTYQTRCPVSGEDISPNASLKMEGVEVFFCCKRCLVKFRKEPVEYASALVDQGYDLGIEGADKRQARDKEDRSNRRRGPAGSVTGDLRSK